MDPFESCTTIRPRAYDVVMVTADNLADVHAAMSARKHTAYLNEGSITFKAASGRLDSARPGDILVGGYEGGLYLYRRYTPSEYAEKFRDLTPAERGMFTATA